MHRPRYSLPQHLIPQQEHTDHGLPAVVPKLAHVVVEPNDDNVICNHHDFDILLQESIDRNVRLVLTHQFADALLLTTLRLHALFLF